METYNRKAIFEKAEDHCVLSKKDDFIEVCEWKNGEGFDITISDKMFCMTWGQFRLLKKIVKKLRKSE